MATQRQGFALDPVTFEVLKNAFITTVDQMAEQILRTCYSFVIYNRDFSSALNDVNGDSIAQGNYDIAVHVGTLHYTCKDVIRYFKDDMHPGDVFAINDPYAGGTHFPDVRLIRPMFVDGKPIAYAQSNGHWSDVGGSVPGSFDVAARDMFREGIRITPIRLWDKGVFRRDVADMIAANTRDPASIIGDMQSQAEATRVAEREILRLVDKYGKDTVVAGFADVQDYVERSMRQRLAALPDGVWETQDFIDRDPSGPEGMIPIKVKMTIDRRPGDLRFHRQPSVHRLAVQLRVRLDVLGGRRGDEDVLPGSAAELRLLSPDRGDRARRHRGQRTLADRRHRVPDAVRKNHELDLRDLVEDHAGARHRLRVQPGIPADRRARPAQPRKADLHVLRLAARRLGRAQRPRRLQRHHRMLRHRPAIAAGRRPGARFADPDHRIPSADGLARPRQMARRRRRAQNFCTCARRTRP